MPSTEVLSSKVHKVVQLLLFPNRKGIFIQADSSSKYKFGAKTNINYGAKFVGFGGGFVCWHDLKTDDPSKFISTRKRRRLFDDVSTRERLVSISLQGFLECIFQDGACNDLYLD